MGQKFGYWIGLEGLQFSEGTSASWIQAFPEGTYSHPVYGDMQFSEVRLKRFANSVTSKIRDADVDIDYDHKKYTGKAAGWVKDAKYEPGKGLSLLVDWTPEAREAIKAGEYKYFSPEFSEEWTHPKTGVKHEDVLFGGAITNRPFLRDILPVNLSELYPDPTPKKDPEGGLMDPKELRKLLGLAETATDAEVTAKLSELQNLQKLLSVQPPTPPTPPTNNPTPPVPPAPETVEQIIAKLTEQGTSPAVKVLTDMLETQRVEITKLRQQDRERQIDQKLSELDQGKTFAVPPAVKEQLRTIMLGSTPELAETVYDAYKKTLELGIVDLTERGWQRRGESESASTTINKEIVALREADKELSYRQAYEIVASERPELAEAARKESYIKEGV